MASNIAAALGVGSALVNTIGLYPYLRDVFKKKTKPERATWWIWLLLNVIALVAQLAAGATWSVFLTLGTILSVGIIAVLSVPYGYGKFQLKDFVSIGVAVLGAIVAVVVKSPLVALAAIIMVDISGYWLTLVKSWEAPYTETLSAWLFASTAALMGTIAVHSTDVSKLIYPLYLLLADTVLVLAIIYRRKTLILGED